MSLHAIRVLAPAEAIEPSFLRLSPALLIVQTDSILTEALSCNFTKKQKDRPYGERSRSRRGVLSKLGHSLP